MHFKRDRNPGAAAYEALVLHPCIPAPVPGCVFEITLLCFGTRARALPAEPPCRTVRGRGEGAPIISCAVSGFTEQVCFHSFKLFSLAGAFRQLHPTLKQV